PMAAAAYRYGRESEIDAWSGFIDRLGAFSQFVNDLFDWHHDHQHGIPTIVQSEWRRRARPGEGIAALFGREGWDRGKKLAEQWYSDRESEANLFAWRSNPTFQTWISERKRYLSTQIQEGSFGHRFLSAMSLPA